jgi:hypothetical protein
MLQGLWHPKYGSFLQFVNLVIVFSKSLQTLVVQSNRCDLDKTTLPVLAPPRGIKPNQFELEIFVNLK